MQHLTSSAILFAASLLFTFPAAAQTADYATISTVPASDITPSRQSIGILVVTDQPPQAAIDILPDALSKEDPVELQAVQFVPAGWSDCLLKCRSAPGLLLGLLGVGLLGAIGAVLAGRRTNNKKERS